jgi:hypothetical protein
MHPCGVVCDLVTFAGMEGLADGIGKRDQRWLFGGEGLQYWAKDIEGRIGDVWQGGLGLEGGRVTVVEFGRRECVSRSPHCSTRRPSQEE